jgi:hypothetical protein
MPITTGSLSCRCFRAKKRPPADYRDTFPLQIKRNRFQPPKTDRGEMRSIGWVDPRNILSSQVDLSRVLLDGQLILALRVDTISLCKPIYQARLRQELSRAGKELQAERLTRDQRAAIEEKLQMDMAKEQTPSTAIREMAWNLKTSEVIFTATGDKACLEFQEIFIETFDVEIEPRVPFLRAEPVARKLTLEAELAAVRPAILSPRDIEDKPAKPEITE